MKHVLVFIWIGVCGFSYAQQNPYVDSLYEVAKDPKRTCATCFADTISSDAYYKIGRDYLGYDPDTTIYFYNMAIKTMDKALQKQAQPSVLHDQIILKRASYISERGW